MKKRGLIFGELFNEYDTAENGWTLAACVITKGNQVQHFVTVPGRHAPLDFSTYLTDGQPYYDSASLEVTLECSDGTREERQARITALVNKLDGYSTKIHHPDHPDHYITGRVQVFPLYSDAAHCAVQISAVCEPWLYSDFITSQDVLVPVGSTTEESLVNGGRLAVVPDVSVTGTVTIEYGEYSWTLSEGRYTMPEIYMTPGTHKVKVSGSSGRAEASFSWREAVLLA